jgi:hypothetical protein
VQKDLSDALATVEEALHQPNMDDGDLRRKQLTMRAVEQQKAADKKEENKKRKEEAKKAEPKARGRPRKKALAADLASASTSLPGPVSQGSAVPAGSSEQPVKRRRIRAMVTKMEPPQWLSHAPQSLQKSLIKVATLIK